MHMLHLLSQQAVANKNGQLNSWFFVVACQEQIIQVSQLSWF